MEILDLLNEESVSGARSGRASLIRREVLLRMFEKVTLPRSRCVCGVIRESESSTLYDVSGLALAALIRARCAL